MKDVKKHQIRQGQVLMELRRYSNMTLHEMAAFSGISKPTLSRLERGETGISLEQCIKLNLAHKIDVIPRLIAAAKDDFIDEWNHLEEKKQAAIANAAGINHGR